MEMKLPQVERIVTETIDGKQVQKQIYADGSYGVRDGDSVKRYFPDGTNQTYIKSADSFRLSTEVLPDGTKRGWYDNGYMRFEKFPDGTKREWYNNGHMKSENLPDGTRTIYNENRDVIYHATKGVEDTVLYLARKHVAERRLEKEEKLSKRKRKRVILPKMYYKFEKAIKMKMAVLKVKKDLGR